MVHGQNMKYINVIPPVAIKDNASWVNVEIDTLGYDYLQVIFMLGATDIAMAVLKMQEATATGGSFADITGLVFGTSTNVAGNTSALPADDEDGNIFIFDINLLGRKRFLDLVATAGDGSAGTYASAIGILSRAGNAPSTAVERGAVEILRV